MRFAFLNLLFIPSLACADMRIEVFNRSGEPAVEYPYKLFEVEIFEGEEILTQPFQIATLDREGGLILRGLKAGQKYQLIIGGEETPQFVFSAGRKIQQRLKNIVVGDVVPDSISYVRLNEGQKLTSADLKGPLVYIEYWAVW